MIEDEAISAGGTLSQTRKRRVWKRPLWRIGLCMFISANLLGSGIQITTLPLVILAPLQASGLIFNTLLAALILHERLTWASLIGTLWVAVGATLVAAYGALDEPTTHTLAQLIRLYSRMAFVVWAACMQPCIIVALLLAAAVARGRLVLRGLLLGAISGILSADTLLLAKTAVELLLRTLLQGENQFNALSAWVIVVGIVVLALVQLYCLNSGLRCCSTSILYPLVFCVYNITAIANGLIYYDQAVRLSRTQVVAVAVGTAVLLAGVGCLSWRPGSISGDDDMMDGPVSPASPQHSKRFWTSGESRQMSLGPPMSAAEAGMLWDELEDQEEEEGDEEGDEDEHQQSTERTRLLSK